MKVTTTTTTKTMSSPGGAEKYYPPPLMRFLRSNVGSKSRGRTASSKSSPLMFINRKRSSSANNNSGLSSLESQQEPSSPTVTCIGQIRVKRGARSGPARRRRCQQCTWVPSAPAACRYEKMRPCCCVMRRPTWPKWRGGGVLFPFSSCTKKRRPQQQEEEEDDDDDDEEEVEVVSPKTQQVVEEEEKRVSVYEVSPPKNALLLPPKNALLLTRCRSAPYWSSSLTYRFGGSPLEPINKVEDQEEDAREEEEEASSTNTNTTTTTTCPTSKRASLSKEEEEEEDDHPLVAAVQLVEEEVPRTDALQPVVLTRCRSEPARPGAEKLDRRKEAELAEMWQVLIAAAVAGSTTLVAKRFLAHGPAQPDEDDETGPLQCTPSPQPQPDRGGGDVIFRFSSSGSSTSRRKKKKKKMKMMMKNKGKETRAGCAGRGPRVTGRLLEYGGGTEPGNGGGRKFVVRLKRRRISKIALSKSSSSKDNSLFSWGLGVGMVCMMSAGNTEIGKLSAAMDETSKVVNELRAELCRRKVAQVMASSRCFNAVSREVGDTRLPLSDDVECPSSVLTEEPELEVRDMEMDQSEAELVSEIKILPSFSNEASNDDSVQTNPDMIIALQAEASTNKFHELEEGRVAYQCHGVGQDELDKRLSHLLIEQQENQIVELESELHSAQSKLHEKEAELQALKQLSQCSISSVSDDDEDHEHESELRDFCSGWNNTCEIGSESRRPVVGMKRPIISAQ